MRPQLPRNMIKPHHPAPPKLAKAGIPAPAQAQVRPSVPNPVVPQGSSPQPNAPIGPQNRPQVSLKATIPTSTQARSVASGLSAAPEIRKKLLDDQIAGRQDLSVPKIPQNITCDLCRSPYREDIEARFHKGEDLKGLSKTYGVPPTLITRHMTHLQAAQKLEGSVASIVEQLEIWRDRTENLYKRMESMLHALEDGFIMDFDEEGAPLLSKPTIRDIKPTVDAILACMKHGTSQLELFARVNGMFQSSEQTGPTVNVFLPELANHTPLMADGNSKAVDTDRSAKMLMTAGDVIDVKTKLTDPVARLVQDLNSGTIPTKQTVVEAIMADPQAPQS